MWAFSKKKEEPVDPPVPEIEFYGPSSLKRESVGDVLKYQVQLWIGGPGWDISPEGKRLSGGWGKIVGLQFEAPSGTATMSEAQMANVLITHAHQIVSAYGMKQATVIAHALRKVFNGHVYTRPHTAQEIMSS